VERRRHLWNSRWGRLGRRDILIFEDAGNWLVEARDGGTDGNSRWFEASDEVRVLEIVTILMDDGDGWRELTRARVDDHP